MRLKRTVQLLEYSNLILVLGLLIITLTFIFKKLGGNFLAIEILIGVPIIISFLLRKVLVKSYLKRSIYPGALYSVLDKLQLTRGLEIEMSDDLLNEIYRPAYSTTQFLNDNHLTTTYSNKKLSPNPKQALVVLVLGGLIFWYLITKFTFGEKPLVFIVLASAALSQVFILFKKRDEKVDEEIVVNFTENGLWYEGKLIGWKDIYDWSPVTAGKGNPASMLINYYDSEKNVQEEKIDLSTSNLDKIDFLLLMAHFKGKYGQ